MVPGGAAESMKKIEVGDRLLEFNGENVSEMQQGDVMKLLIKSTGSRLLKFHPRKVILYIYIYICILTSYFWGNLIKLFTFYIFIFM